MDFVTPLLALVMPHLPALLMKAAEDVVGEGAKKAVYEAVPSGVKAIWAKLKPKVEESPIAQSAIEKVAAEPENAKRVTALELAIEDLLGELAKKEPEWMASLQALLKAAEAESAGAENIVNQDVSGDGNQVTGINYGKTVQMGDVAGDVNF